MPVFCSNNKCFNETWTWHKAKGYGISIMECKKCGFKVTLDHSAQTKRIENKEKLKRG